MIRKMEPYIEKELSHGVELKHITRHLLDSPPGDLVLARRVAT